MVIESACDLQVDPQQTLVAEISFRAETLYENDSLDACGISRLESRRLNTVGNDADYNRSERAAFQSVYAHQGRYQ